MFQRHVEAEGARLMAEEGRITGEVQRREAEEWRIEDEDARQSSETARDAQPPTVFWIGASATRHRLAYAPSWCTPDQPLRAWNNTIHLVPPARPRMPAVFFPLPVRATALEKSRKHNSPRLFWWRRNN